jgi:hypothetical protein
VDRAEKDYIVALSQYKAVQETFHLVKERFTKEEIDAAVAKVEQAKASLREAQVQLSYATISAISGTIASATTAETVSAALMHQPSSRSSI